MPLGSGALGERSGAQELEEVLGEEETQDYSTWCDERPPNDARAVRRELGSLHSALYDT